MREGVRRSRRRRWRRWREGTRGEPGERLESQQNEGESKRGVVGIEYQRGTWLEGTGEEMRGIESTFVCLFSPTPCSSSISPH